MNILLEKLKEKIDDYKYIKINYVDMSNVDQSAISPDLLEIGDDYILIKSNNRDVYVPVSRISQIICTKRLYG